MRKGREILERQVGKTLYDGIIQSFYLNSNLVDKINILYLQFDSWLHLNTTDKTAIFEIDKTYPEQMENFNFEDSSDLCKYPLIKLTEVYPQFQAYIGRELINFSELELKGYRDVTCGIKLYFEEKLTITIYSDENDNTFLHFDTQNPTDLIEVNLFSDRHTCPNRR